MDWDTLEGGHWRLSLGYRPAVNVFANHHYRCRWSSSCRESPISSIHLPRSTFYRTWPPRPDRHSDRFFMSRVANWTQVCAIICNRDWNRSVGRIGPTTIRSLRVSMSLPALQSIPLFFDRTTSFGRFIVGPDSTASRSVDSLYFFVFVIPKPSLDRVIDWNSWVQCGGRIDLLSSFINLSLVSR